MLISYHVFLFYFSICRQPGNPATDKILGIKFVTCPVYYEISCKTGLNRLIGLAGLVRTHKYARFLIKKKAKIVRRNPMTSVFFDFLYKVVTIEIIFLK